VLARWTAAVSRPVEAALTRAVPLDRWAALFATVL